MSKPTLVLLAAGMGSRFGGPKQLEPLGPGGETLLELTLYDAWRAGFRRAVVVTRQELLDALRDRLQRVAGHAWEFVFVLQRPDRGPSGSTRTKPWGTAHAVLSASAALNGPFAVANADDAYGWDALAVLAAALGTLATPDAPDPSGRAFLVTYALKHTLSPHGGVSRGICSLDENGVLIGIEEVLDLAREPGGRVTGRQLSGVRRTCSGEEPVSLNLWGFEATFLDQLGASFDTFRPTATSASEHQLPTAVAEFIQTGGLRVQSLPTDSTWVGVTHPEDAAPARRQLAAWFAEGRYPSPLFP